MKHPIASSVANHARRGFSIVAAIFLLVVLAGLGVAIVTVATTQQRGAASDLLGTRASGAARSGLEWGMYNVNINPATQQPYIDPVTLTGTRSCPTGSATNTFSFAMPAAATTLSAFTVTVKCTAIADASGGPTVFQIDSWACNSPNTGWNATSVAACPYTGSPLPVNYVERYMRVFM